MITASLSNGFVDLTLPPLEVSLDTETLENATDVTTLDFNIYTDFINSKRLWSMGWDSVTEEEFNSIKTMYDSQFTLFQYPLLSIPYYSISDVPVRMTMNIKQVWNNCGDVQNLQITLRETTQIPEIGESS